VVSTVMPATRGVVRLDSLTGLRWWAAFAVFMFHMRNIAPLPIGEVARLGNYGVAFFFILSGFVLTWSARPTVNAPTFWWRRFARIWPAHMVALLLAIPVFYSFDPDPAQTWVKPVSVGVLLLSVVLLQGWSRDPAILFSGNPAAWTLTCEAFFYALHPAINRVVGKLQSRGALIVAGAVVVASLLFEIARVLWPATILSSIPWPIARLNEFVIGMLIARAMLAGWNFRLPPLACYVVGGAGLLALGVAPRFSGDRPWISTTLQFTDLIVIVIFAVTIASVASRDVRGGRSLLRSRLLVMLGDTSYAFYLVHATVIYAVLAIVGQQAGGWLNLVWYPLMLVPVIALAAALHFFVEKPAEKRMRAWWDRRRAAKQLAAVGT
jgi:peptidoglycan/LPS O-acetylase OafA/YrhL